MTKIRMAVSAALVAAVGLVGSQAASASTDPAVAPSDLFAAVWNTATNTSFVVDLGTPFASLTDPTQFENPAGFTQSWTIDGTQLSTDLGGAPTNFAVFAADQSAAPNKFFVGLNSTAPTLQTTAVTNNGVPAVRSYVFNNLPGATTSILGTSTTYWANCPTGPGCQSEFTVNSLNGLASADPASGSLSFYEYVAGANSRTNASTNPIGNSAGVGVFTLSGDTLTYTLAAVGGGGPEVPLPAAGWLLISGLFGFGAVSRRRDAKVAA